MTTKSRLALLSSLAATPAFAAPFLAIGDNAELFLTARTEARYEDNVTFAPNNELQDEIFEFVPGLDLTFGKNSLTKGSVSFYERFVGYSDHTEFNDQLANFLFKASHEGAKLKVDADASYKELNQNSRDAVAANQLVRRNETTAGLSGELAVTEKSKVGLGARYSQTDYRTGDFTDRDVYTVPVNYYFAITPKVDLSAGVQYRKNQVDAPNKDSDEVYYNVGARGDFTAKLTGSFSVGYTTRSPDNGSDDDLFGLRAGLVYLYSPKTQFTLDLSNDFDTSSTGGGQESSSINLGVRSALTAALTANIGIGYQKIKYLSVTPDRTDDYVTALIGATYAVNQNISLEASYSYLNNSSDISDAEFNANIVTLAANFRY